MKRALVLRVLDGDSLLLRVGSNRVTAELGGVATAGMIPVEVRSGRRARRWLQGQLTNGTVEVNLIGELGSKPIATALRDSQGADVIAAMVRSGYAFVDREGVSHSRQKELNRLERRARSAKQGLWGTWEDMGYAPSVRVARRAERELWESANPSTIPAGAAPESAFDPVTGVSLRPSIFEPSGPISSQVGVLVTAYNNSINAYLGTTNCQWMSTARIWAEAAYVYEGYPDLVTAFNAAIRLSNCEMPLLSMGNLEVAAGGDWIMVGIAGDAVIKGGGERSAGLPPLSPVNPDSGKDSGGGSGNQTGLNGFVPREDLNDPEIRGYINNYNENIDNYNRYRDCVFVGLAKSWANFALGDGYSALADHFNEINSSVNCGITNLII